MDEVKLHLGCGGVILPGFINIDIRPLENVDKIDDISKLESVEDNSVDLIYCCHVLEHFTRHEYKHVLSRWYQLLKPGGKLRISVPDFESVVKHYNANKDLKPLIGLLYGGQQYKQNFHMMTWDLYSITNDLKEIGFSDITRYDWKNVEHGMFDDFSQAYLPHMDKIDGRLMSLNVEATK